MTRAEVVNEIANATGVERAAVQKTVGCFMEVVKDALGRDRNVYLRGFGSFIVKKRAQKKARNISKNTSIMIPEHCIPAFKPYKSLRGKVKNSVKRV